MTRLHYIVLCLLLVSCDFRDARNHNGSGHAATLKIEKEDFKSEIVNALRMGPTGSMWEYEEKLAVLYAKSDQPDSAFYYLQRYVNSDSSENVFCEPGFYNLLHDPRWESIEQKQFEKSLRQGRMHKDREITLQLWRMHITDQAFYADLHYYNKKYGYGNLMYDSIVKSMELMNKENLKKLIPILNTVTWPKISEYDSLASTTAFLVIQHSNDSLQSRYLPVIESYCKAGEACWQHFCLMKDRLLVNTGRPQIYGTQMRINNGKIELWKIEDSINVDKRRKEKGLMPLKDYFEFMIRR